MSRRPCATLRRSITTLAATLVLFATPAFAGRVTCPPWQWLCLRTDLIGIVECTKAGGIVAEYKVIESWKGRPAGSVVRLRMASNRPFYSTPAWGEFSIALCGERYLVAAYSTLSFDRPDVFEGDSPVAWRVLDSDYDLEISGGRVPLPLTEGPKKLARMGSKHEDLESLRTAMRRLLSMDTERQELVLLRLDAKKHFDSSPPRRKEAMVSAAEMLSATNEAEFFGAAIRFAKQSKKADDKKLPVELCASACTVNGLRLVESYVADSPKKFREYAGRELGYTKWRLGLEDGPVPDFPTAEGPTDEEVAEARRKLAAGDFPTKLDDSILTLVESDPSFVIDCLIDSERGGLEAADASEAYRLASMIAVRLCHQSGAPEKLRRLGRAVDPTVRVAAAVYLAFHDESAGIEALRREVKRRDAAGDWAALTLVRRGDESVVSRALELLRRPGEEKYYQLLTNRLRVVLSNSAAASGVKAPPRDLGESWHATDARARFRTYRKWWDEVGKKITLHDPWLAALAKQKVD